MRPPEMQNLDSILVIIAVSNIVGKIYCAVVPDWQTLCYPFCQWVVIVQTLQPATKQSTRGGFHWRRAHREMANKMRVGRRRANRWRANRRTSNEGRANSGSQIGRRNLINRGSRIGRGSLIGCRSGIGRGTRISRKEWSRPWECIWKSQESRVLVVQTVLVGQEVQRSSVS